MMLMTKQDLNVQLQLLAYHDLHDMQENDPDIVVSEEAIRDHARTYHDLTVGDLLDLLSES